MTDHMEATIAGGSECRVVCPVDGCDWGYESASGATLREVCEVMKQHTDDWHLS